MIEFFTNNYKKKYINITAINPIFCSKDVIDACIERTNLACERHQEALVDDPSPLLKEHINIVCKRYSLYSAESFLTDFNGICFLAKLRDIFSGKIEVKDMLLLHIWLYVNRIYAPYLNLLTHDDYNKFQHLLNKSSTQQLSLKKA